MTARARQIGLEKSTFVNSTGLPADGQQTTVREMALLALHLWRDYPDLYRYFGQKDFTWNKIAQKNRNPLLSMDIGADGLANFDRVVVESHPSLVGPRTRHFLDALGAYRRSGRRPPVLEVAMGLETAHAAALDQINKRLTVDGFVRAAGRLRQYGAALRVFLLVSPPFVPRDEQDTWMLHSVDVAIASGATAISLIPTRAGNGALEALATEGLFIEPTLADLERSAAAALEHIRRHGSSLRVFADLWNLDRFASCLHCLDARRARLTKMNLEQRVHPPVACAHCGGAS